MGPESTNGRAGPPANAPNANTAPSPSPSPSTSPSSAPSSSPEPLSYIEDAYQNMLADDLPLEQDAWGPGAPPTEPSYPQPVQPAPAQSQPVARPTQQPVAPLQPTQQPQPEAPPQPIDPAEASRAAAQERVRRDPFGVQAEMIEQQTQQYVEALAKEVYPVSIEDVDAFLSGDGTKISQALARVHVNAVGSMMRVVSQQMPVWVNNMLQLHSTAKSREDQFWERNSFLNRKEHANLALTTARAYRQMYPQANDDQIDRMVGAMVAVAAGIQVPAGHSSQPSASRTAPVSTSFRTPGPVVRRVQPPFQPAGTAVAGGPRQASPGGQWSELADILLADQAGKLDNVT